MKLSKDKKKEIEKKLNNEAVYHLDKLVITLTHILNDGKPKGAHVDWLLIDCYNMKNFYNLIMAGKYKKAFNRLNYLAKECNLVPTKIWELLDQLYNPYI